MTALLFGAAFTPNFRVYRWRCCWRSIDANQYEIPFKLNISTFHVSVMASTPAIASHIVRHPSSSNFSVFMAPRQAAVTSGVRG